MGSKRREGLDIDALSPPEEDGHEQGMGKADLDAIYQSIPGALENGEVIVKSGIREDILHGRH
jgi:hypothetical protein